MKVVVVGSGGREHALAEVLGRTAEVVVTPGNPGIPGSTDAPVEDLVAAGRVRKVADAPVLRQPVFAALHIRHRIAPLHRRLRRVVFRRLAGKEAEAD